jgi:hypothetical protein
VRIWDAVNGRHEGTLLALAGGGWAVVLPDGRYKLAGDQAEIFWWAIKLKRFGAGELDPYVSHVTRLDHAERVFRLA